MLGYDCFRPCRSPSDYSHFTGKSEGQHDLQDGRLQIDVDSCYPAASATRVPAMTEVIEASTQTEFNSFHQDENCDE